MIACAGIVPLALICGHLRGIPFWWQLADMSFGIVGERARQPDLVTA
jgi:hypothetical protein